MSFFQKKSARGVRKRKNNPPVAGPPRKSKKSHADDEEILSDASDVEGRPNANGDAGYESVDDGDRDDLRETAEEKAGAKASALAMEVEREERDEVSNKRLTSMAYDVANGLAFLHEQKYVHRDVACRNCLVNSSRTIKLADFGMTRQMFQSDYYRFSRRGMLPVRWMSPESLADGIFSPMSDVWSYGVLLYEIITFGSFPFQGLSNNQVLENVKNGQTLSQPIGIKSQL